MLIEEGKYYRALNGSKIGPMVRSKSGWVSSERIDPSGDFDWYYDGLFYRSNSEHPLTLVSEWVDDPVSETIDGDGEMYEPLRSILNQAYEQAASGKGRERHANGRPFDRQPIAEIGRMVGIGFNLGQSIKKQQEAKGMLDRGETDAAIRELLGAINYTASAVMLLRESISEN